jgi:hypothetical protein
VRLFSSKRDDGLSTANVPADWIPHRAWELWDPPWNLVAGESYRQDELLRAAGLKRPTEHGVLKPVVVTFVREPTNEYDENAIMALVLGLHVGYLRRHLAAKIANCCDTNECIAFRVCGILRGGIREEAEFVGCHLWHDRRLSRAPAIELSDDDQEWAVQWPPTDRESRLQ